mgnify:CR=1 FL=1
MKMKEKTANGGGKLYSFKGVWPKIADDCFIAPGARVIGNVEIGSGSSVWFNCVLRGDIAKIQIGKNSNIQDGSVVHVDSGGFDVKIGDNVLIGHMAMIHGTTIEDYGFVGFNGSTMDGSYIEKHGMLAAGSLLSPNKRIGTKELWIGRPAKFVRNLDDEMIKKLSKAPEEYARFAQQFLQED